MMLGDTAPFALGTVGWLFRLLDQTHRAAGELLDATWLGAVESPYRTVATFPGARLRAYSPANARDGPALLIIAAPFKRAYIWDLMPEISVVRRCVLHGLGVYLLEWAKPDESMNGIGLADYGDQLIGMGLDAIDAERGGRSGKTVIAGHSLGGTLGAIFASLHPERVSGLVLLDAPLSFGEDGDQLAAVIRTMPHARALEAMFGSPVPGSVITLLCVLAMPQVFLGQPALDLGQSMADSDADALSIHAHVRRWTLDEFPLPSQFFEDAFELLYRENRFMHGTLEIRGRRASADQLRGPVLAVVNPTGEVVPPASILNALDRARHITADIRVCTHGHGPALQHLAPLVTPAAHRRLWPEIIRWIEHHTA